MATLVCRNLRETVAAYCDYLDLQILEQQPAGDQLAGFYNTPGLANANSALLANRCGEPWLRIVEDPDSIPLEPLKHHGWLSLEVLVEDVDKLVEGLSDSPFDILRPVANLELSDNIRACQVKGPCGEVLYLTQIKGAVPPFDLPRARCFVDRLFIPVLCAPDRDSAQAFYQGFANTKGLAFDTKITVVNQAYGYELERQHPVAVMLLAGQSMIEIDEIAAAKPRPDSAGRLSAGIASVSFEVDSLEALDLDWVTAPAPLYTAPYDGRRVGLVTGMAGELIELIERRA